MKTPEEYFVEQNFDADHADKGTKLSDSEQLFIDKYLNGDTAGIKSALADETESGHTIVLHSADQDQKQSEPEVQVRNDQVKHTSKDQAPALGDKERLKAMDDVQLVSFFMGRQEYALPIETVNEVIKFIQPTKLPAAPVYLEGVINLRQKVTPIVRLAELLNPGKGKDVENRFIVVCRKDNFQVGLLVERIATMYRMPREDIEWSVESALAMNSSYVAALIKNREKIISILSIDAIVGRLLNE
ncbi:chemotaxis protein CheW [Desulfonatronovibrio magnus]|uniref:chemotaxis protein CheW n=1 Tax=Desulfonatronovibrio magnus TaxID=698827 RepID=UPI0006972AC6|nr:chemotaxis protein CheW [Desulfonatronovibrio magnus]